MRVGLQPTPASREGATSFLFPKFPSATSRCVTRSPSARRWAVSSPSLWLRRARAKGGEFVTQAGKVTNREARLGGIGAVVAAELSERTGKETRVVVLGHLQRGGGPTTFDRLLCTRFGARAVKLVQEGAFGFMVALRPPDTVSVRIAEAIGHLRTVPVDGDIVQTARMLGISFGDE